MNEDEEIEKWFTYHPPKGTQPERYESIRKKAKELAYVIRDSLPLCSDQTIALRKLRECVMIANAAIACNE